MIKKIVFISIIVFLTSIKILAYGYSNIEIFDINKGCVVKTVESSRSIQTEVESYLNGITNLYGKFKPIPNTGIMIKIYLEPPVTLENKFLKGSIDEVIIILPEKEKPFLMVFDSKLRPFFYNFEGDTDNLLKNLKYDPKSTPCLLCISSPFIYASCVTPIKEAT